MEVRLTRRRVIVALVALLVVGGISGAIAMRVAKKAAESRENDNKAPVTLEFAPADLAVVAPTTLGKRLPVSGTMQPVRQATVKAKVSGDVRVITVRDGDTVQAGQMLVRVDTADLDAKLIEGAPIPETKPAA